MPILGRSDTSHFTCTKLIAETSLTKDEVGLLLTRFSAAAGAGGLLSRSEFVEAVLKDCKPDSDPDQGSFSCGRAFLAGRLFDVALVGHRGARRRDLPHAKPKMDFEQYARIVSVFSPNASVTEKAFVCFKLFDLEEQELVTVEGLSECMRLIFAESTTKLNDAQIRCLVLSTFDRMNKPQGSPISVVDFERFFRKSQPLTLLFTQPLWRLFDEDARSQKRQTTAAHRNKALAEASHRRQLSDEGPEEAENSTHSNNPPRRAFSPASVGGSGPGSARSWSTPSSSRSSLDESVASFPLSPSSSSSSFHTPARDDVSPWLRMSFARAVSAALRKGSTMSAPNTLRYEEEGEEGSVLQEYHSTAFHSNHGAFTDRAATAEPEEALDPWVWRVKPRSRHPSELDKGHRAHSEKTTSMMLSLTALAFSRTGRSSTPRSTSSSSAAARRSGHADRPRRADRSSSSSSSGKPSGKNNARAQRRPKRFSSSLTPRGWKRSSSPRQQELQRTASGSR